MCLNHKSSGTASLVFYNQSYNSKDMENLILAVYIGDTGEHFDQYVGKFGSTSWAHDSSPPMMSLAEVKPILWRYSTALCESLPLLHTTQILVPEWLLPFCSSSSFKAELISDTLASKLESGMFNDFGRETMLKWCDGRTSTNTCASPLTSLSLYSLLVILESAGSRFNFNGVCNQLEGQKY